MARSRAVGCNSELRSARSGPRRGSAWLPAPLLLASLALGCGASGGAGGSGTNAAGSAGTGSDATAGSSGASSSVAGSGGPTGAGAGGVGTAGGSGSVGVGGLAAAGGAGSIAGAAGVGGSVGSAGSAGSAASGGSNAAGGAGGAGTAGSAGAGAGAGGTSNDPCGPSNPGVRPLPVIGAGTFDVTKYGAVGDGVADETKALQAALDAAGSAGGGTVVVPKGTFLSGPIVLSSSTALQLSAGAVLKMLPRAKYPSITPLITASKVHDIAITGSGTIDGQGQDWWDAFAADSTVLRPQEVSLSGSTRVLISGVRFQNPPEEHIWVKNDTDVTVTGITISTLAVSGKSPPKNTDGVDISANGGFLCNNNIAAGDDNIALSGNDIYIGYSQFGVGHGCSIGSITKNGTARLTVEHVTFEGTTSGIRMKSARDRGGLVQDLSYSNITMHNVPNPVFITSYYPTLPTDPTADTAQAVTATTPYWKNITIKNLTATGSTNSGIIWGLPEAKVSGLTFDNVQISGNTGMTVYHATGVSFINGSKVTPSSGAAVTVSDAAVTGITTTAY